MQRLPCTLASSGAREKPVSPRAGPGLADCPIRRSYLRSLGIAGAVDAPPTRGRSSQWSTATSQWASTLTPTISTLASEDSESEQSEAEVSASKDSVMPTCSSLNGSTGPMDFRARFLGKLSYAKIWMPAAQRPPKSQTVIIFDWDDTLLCTSFLHRYGAVPPRCRQCLEDIGHTGRELLELARQLGRTFIITNSLTGWVEQSAASYAPELLPALRQVDVISARTRYEPHFPRSQWKVQAFLEVQRQMDSQVVTNLLSVGDSDFEMDAAHVMGREFAQVSVKTVRFQPSPAPEELLKGLQWLVQNFQRIVETGKPLKICLERRPVA